MSQQINLLRKERRPVNMTVWALGGCGVIGLGVVLLVQAVLAETAQLSKVASDGEQRIAQVKSAIAVLQKKRDGQDSAAAVAAEIAVLRLRSAAVNQVVNELRNGTLGSAEGFARYFTILGGVAQDGVWITGVAVTRGGSAMALTGRALRHEAVIQYAQRLNEAFAPTGVRFLSLELNPENPGKPATTGADGPTTIAFKLF